MLIEQALVQQLNAWDAAASQVFAPNAEVPAELLARWVAEREIRVKPAVSE